MGGSGCACGCGSFQTRTRGQEKIERFRRETLWGNRAWRTFEGALPSAYTGSQKDFPGRKTRGHQSVKRLGHLEFGVIFTYFLLKSWDLFLCSCDESGKLTIRYDFTCKENVFLFKWRHFLPSGSRLWVCLFLSDVSGDLETPWSWSYKLWIIKPFYWAVQARMRWGLGVASVRHHVAVLPGLDSY